jgi:hypothetical protein
MSKSLKLHELKKVYSQTNRALNELLEKNGIKKINQADKNQKLEKIKLESLRKKMANNHNNKVSILVEVLGKENTITQSRKVLFEVGVNLGKRARLKLGIGDSFSDFSKALKLMYKILGNEIQLKKINREKAILYVNRCSLSESYTNITCQVLSSVDEGMVHGLNPKYEMVFKKRITCGSSRCLAEIKINMK